LSATKVFNGHKKIKKIKKRGVYDDPIYSPINCLFRFGVVMKKFATSWGSSFRRLELKRN